MSKTEVVYCGPALPKEIKDARSLSEFKRKIKNGIEILAFASAKNLGFL